MSACVCVLHTQCEIVIKHSYNWIHNMLQHESTLRNKIFWSCQLRKSYILWFPWKNHTASACSLWPDCAGDWNKGVKHQAKDQVFRWVPLFHCPLGVWLQELSACMPNENVIKHTEISVCCFSASAVSDQGLQQWLLFPALSCMGPLPSENLWADQKSAGLLGAVHTNVMPKQLWSTL